MEREPNQENQMGDLLTMPEYGGAVTFFMRIPIHKDKFTWNFEIEGQKRQIPVFSIWNYEHHAEIAKMIAAGKV